MKEALRIKITTTQRRILRVRPALVCAHCPICGHEVETLAQAQAAEVLDVSHQILAEMIAAGLIHAIPTVSGSLRICRNSLLAKWMKGLSAAALGKPASQTEVRTLNTCIEFRLARSSKFIVTTHEIFEIMLPSDIESQRCF